MKTTLMLLLMGTAQLAHSQNATNWDERFRRSQLESTLQNQQNQLNRLQLEGQMNAAKLQQAIAARGNAPSLVKYLNGVPQPPELSNSIRSGTRAANNAKTAAYLEALVAYNAQVAQEQKAAQQVEALRQEIARLTEALQKANQLATEQAQPKAAVTPKRAAP